MAKMTSSEALALYKQAEAAGLAAGSAVTPTPMVVGTPSTPLGSDIDYSQRTYFVSEGACGFAWVNIKGTEPFARAIKKAEQSPEGFKAGIRTSKGYPTGLTVKWVGEFNQSVDRKSKYAAAFAEVLRAAGVTSAYSQSRLD